MSARPKGARTGPPATSIGSPPKNCTSDRSPAARRWSWCRRRRRRRRRTRPAGRPRRPHRCRGGTAGGSRSSRGEGTSLRTYPPPMVERGQHPTLQLEVDGRQVEVADEGASLLEVLRSALGIRSPKDGCSPQGQCGCCTVLVDGQPRVACVTPARRVAGRSVTTLEGLPPDVQRQWADAFSATGASQCGFCTPGIICRLEGAARQGRGGRRPRRRRAGAPRPPLPLHRMAHDPRRVGRRHDRPPSRRPRPGRRHRAGQPRGRRASGGRARGGRRPRRVRR